jgi:hypothetical protein
MLIVFVDEEGCSEMWMYIFYSYIDCEVSVWGVGVRSITMTE